MSLTITRRPRCPKDATADRRAVILAVIRELIAAGIDPSCGVLARRMQARGWDVTASLMAWERHRLVASGQVVIPPRLRAERLLASGRERGLLGETEAERREVEDRIAAEREAKIARGGRPGEWTVPVARVALIQADALSGVCESKYGLCE